MAQFQELKTKKAKLSFIRDKIVQDDRWLLSGLLTIYKFQTDEEKMQETTKVNNGVGFSGFDAEFMTSIAKRVLSRIDLPTIKKSDVKASQFLSKDQEAILRNKMKKYAGQLLRITESKPQVN